ncbi:MAG: sulfurtransferase TusA family protein [Magnetococcales bacterium]|nr:sulfurtransferase TusA family protein [Magnetococcales bacterium]
MDPLQSDPRRHPVQKNPACPLCARQRVAVTAPDTTPAELPHTEEQTIDITQEQCPMTFVKVKLKLATMAPGQPLRVRLAAGEPLLNVPRTLRDQGHLVSEPWEEEDGTFGLLVTKAG